MPRKTRTKTVPTEPTPDEDENGRKSTRQKTSSSKKTEVAVTPKETGRSRRSTTAAQTAASVADSQTPRRRGRRGSSASEESNSRDESPQSRAPTRRALKQVSYVESDGDEGKEEEKIPEEDYNAEEDLESDSGDSALNKGVTKTPSPQKRGKTTRAARSRSTKSSAKRRQPKATSKRRGAAAAAKRSTPARGGRKNAKDESEDEEMEQDEEEEEEPPTRKRSSRTATKKKTKYTEAGTDDESSESEKAPPSKRRAVTKSDKESSEDEEKPEKKPPTSTRASRASKRTEEKKAVPTSNKRRASPRGKEEANDAKKRPRVDEEIEDSSQESKDQNDEDDSKKKLTLPDCSVKISCMKRYEVPNADTSEQSNDNKSSEEVDTAKSCDDEKEEKATDDDKKEVKTEEKIEDKKEEKIDEKKEELSAEKKGEQSKETPEVETSAEKKEVVESSSSNNNVSSKSDPAETEATREETREGNDKESSPPKNNSESKTVQSNAEKTNNNNSIPIREPVKSPSKQSSECQKAMANGLSEVHSSAEFNNIFNGRKFVINQNISDEIWSRCQDRTFSVVCYNLGGEAPKPLENLASSLKLLKSEVVCMQGVNEMFHKGYLQATLNALGYEGTFSLPTNQNLGFSIFYQTPLLKLKNQVSLSLKDTVKKELQSSLLPEQLESVLQQIRACGDILLTNLEFNVPGKDPTNIVLANISIPQSDLSTHALQMACLAREALSFLENPSTPIVMCGAFNMKSSDASYQLLRDGYLSNDMIETLQSKKDIKVPGKDENTALINLLWKSFQHSATGLKSCYNAVLGQEIPSDMIWFSSSSLHAINVLEPSLEVKSPENSLSFNKHLMLKATLALAT